MATFESKLPHQVLNTVAAVAVLVAGVDQVDAESDLLDSLEELLLAGTPRLEFLEDLDLADVGEGLVPLGLV